MPTYLRIIGAGAVVGFVESFTIWFVPEEPYPDFIVLAGTLKGVVVALLIASFVDRRSRLSKSLATGGLFGLLVSGMVFLAKGGWATWDAPFVVPFGLAAGLVLGAIVHRVNDRALE